MHHLSGGDHHAPRTGARRAAGLTAVTALLGAVLALAPVPRLVTVPAMATETRQVEVEHPEVPGTTASTDPDDHVVGEADLEPFAMVGVSVDPDGVASHDDHVDVEVRVRSADVWGEWQTLHVEDDHGPDPASPEAATATASEPLWVGHADGYELRLPDGAEDVAVHLVRESGRQVQVALGEPADAAVAIRSRASWGARPPSAGPFVAPDLRMAVVHHSAGASSYAAAEVPSIIRAMQAYHMDARGWYDLAYNFVVDRFGVVWEGRGGGTRAAVIGGHSAGFNTGTVGVVVLGDFTGAIPTQAAVNAVGELLAWKFAVHGIDPASSVPYTTGVGSTSHQPGTYTFPRVVSHRDVGATSCPGNQLFSTLGAIRSRVASRYPVHLPEQPRLVLAGDFGGDGRTDVLRYRRGASPDEVWSGRPDGTVGQVSRPVGGTYRPVVGDFDGDGRDDVFWHGTGTTADSVWYGAATGHTSVAVSVSGSYVPFAGDFDGDGIDDIFWYAPGPAADAVWYGRSGRTFAPSARSVAGDYTPIVADFDGDGLDDVLWYRAGEPKESMWYGRTDRTFDGRAVTPISGAYAPVAGDFDGDGRDDVFWYAPGAAADFIWFAGATRGSFRSSGASVGGTYRPYALDVAGDGATDILWYAPGAAPDHLWQFAPGGAVVSSATPVSGSYDVVVGDVDGDGHGDVVWSGASLSSSYVWLGGPAGRFRTVPLG